MSIKFLVLGGDFGFWVLGFGGGSVDFNFMGAGNFLKNGRFYRRGIRVGVKGSREETQ